MRLPQSLIQSLFVRTVHFLAMGIAIALLGMVPVNAAAATPQLVCTPAALRFGATVVGQTETLLLTATNNGQTSVTVSAITVSNSDFTASSLSLPVVLLAGQSVDLSVSFTPTATGHREGTIKFSSNASNPTLAIEVAGGGVSAESVIASPATVSFGQVAIGARSTVPVVITNDRPWKVLISALPVSGSEFSVSGPAIPLTLAVGQSVALNVTFTPQFAGLIGGSLFVGGPALTIPLTGTGTAPGQLGVAPAPLNFGNVPEGTTATLPITVSAIGASVTVSSSASSSSQFVLDGASFPFTIPAGQSRSFNVAFTPQSGGTSSGSLTFASNASNSPSVESLTGAGTVTQYSVSLSWSASSDVVGYNVYRSAAANGTYSKINSSLNSSTAYSDTTVLSGQTYYYAATSVNSSGQESARSTPPVQALIP